MSARRGFTILECVLAAGLVLIGFLAIAKINPMSYRGATLSREHLTAIRIARNVIEQVRSRPFGSDVSDLKGPQEMKGELVEGNAFTQPFKVESVNTTIALPTSTCGTVSVTVSWREGTATGSAGIDKKVTLTGGLSREP